MIIMFRKGSSVLFAVSVVLLGLLLPTSCSNSQTICDTSSVSTLVSDFSLTCTSTDTYGATIEGDWTELGLTFGLYFTIDPCLSQPSFSFGYTDGSTATELTSLTYGESQEVAIPGLSYLGIGVDLVIELDGTLENTQLKLGLSCTICGTVQLLGDDGVSLSIAADECPTCAYILEPWIPCPSFLNGIDCGGVYGIIASVVVVVFTLLGISCCACCKTCCFRRKQEQRHYVAFAENEMPPVLTTTVRTI
jgi:hypothetical protein